MLEGVNLEDSQTEVQQTEVQQNVQTEQIQTQEVEKTEPDPRKRQLKIKTGQAELSVKEEPNYELWFYDDEIPGKGAKPEWLNNDTFKTVMAKAKAHTDAQRKIQQLQEKLKDYGEVPEDYVLDLPEELKEFEWNKDELITEVKKLKEVAKTNKITQEGFSDILKLFAGHLQRQEDEIVANHKKYIDEQLYKINPSKMQAKSKLQDLAVWIKQEYPKMELEKVKHMLNSYEAYYVLNTIRSTKPKAAIPVGNPEQPPVSRFEARNMMKSERYLREADYRNKVNAYYDNLGKHGLLS